MADVAVQTIVEAGLQPVYSAVAASDALVGNDGACFLHVKNGNASPTNVTITAQQTAAPVPGMGSLARGNIVVTVPASTGDRMIGPFPRQAFEDGNGKVQVTYSVTASVTAAFIKLPRAL